MAYQPYNNYYPYRTEPQQNTMQGLSAASRPVASQQEAEAIPADFSGSLMVFPDITNNKVYIKRWNPNTGTAYFDVFAPEINIPVTYVTSEDFAALKAEVEKLRKPKKKVSEDDDE